MQIIPFKEPAAWSEQINLTNSVFIFYFRWNALNKYWVMNIYDQNNAPILLGVKIVTNYDLTKQFVVSGLPAGDIICQNILNEWIDIGRFDMGQTNELIYYEPGEVEAIENEILSSRLA
jgi:hypothetical protein